MWPQKWWVVGGESGSRSVTLSPVSIWGVRVRGPSLNASLSVSNTKIALAPTPCHTRHCCVHGHRPSCTLGSRISRIQMGARPRASLHKSSCCGALRKRKPLLHPLPQCGRNVTIRQTTCHQLRMPKQPTGTVPYFRLLACTSWTVGSNTPRKWKQTCGRHGTTATHLPPELMHVKWMTPIPLHSGTCLMLPPSRKTVFSSPLLPAMSEDVPPIAPHNWVASTSWQKVTLT